MKRIALVSEKTENSEEFIKLLNALFPECEIRIVSPGLEGIEERTQDFSSKFGIPDVTDHANAY